MGIKIAKGFKHLEKPVDCLTPLQKAYEILAKKERCSIEVLKHIFILIHKIPRQNVQIYGLDGASNTIHELFGWEICI